MRYIKIALLIGILAWLLQSASLPSLYAADLTCNAFVNPTDFDILSSSEIRFTIVNTGSEPEIKFVRITPPDRFTITTNYSNEPWAGGTEDDGTMLFRQSSILPGESMTFTMVALTNASSGGTDTWKVETADNEDGISAVECAGNLVTSMHSMYNDQAPLITNAVVSEITTNSAIVTWDTDKDSTSIVNYGVTSTYDKNQSDPAPVKKHKITLNNLTANTNYHFQIKSADSDGNSGESNDTSFTTASSTLDKPATVIVITPTPSASPSPTPTPIPDSEAPKITILSNLTKVFTQAPQVAGVATDNKEIDLVEYSLNQGKSWSVVDKINNSPKKAEYEITPLIKEDGNYEIAIRAKDKSGNTGVPVTAKFIIDRLPPISGPYIASVENQILDPHLGLSIVPINKNIKITIPTVGGANSVSLHTGSTTTQLEQNIDTHLWSGDIRIDTTGNTPFTVKAQDQAGNETIHNFNPLFAVEPGKIIDESNLPLSKAKITVYKKSIGTMEFELWNASAINQANPILSNRSGEYPLILPQGTYYLEVQAPGYYSFKTPIFTTTHNMIYNNFFILKKTNLFKSLTPLFEILGKHGGSIIDNQTNIKELHPALMRKEVPAFTVANELESVTEKSIRGRKTVITFLNSWSPQISDQIHYIQNIETNNVSKIIIFPEESSAAIRVLKKQGNYTVPMFADPDGTLVNAFDLQRTPTSFFIGEDGIIKSIKTGVVSSEDIVNNTK